MDGNNMTNLYKRIAVRQKHTCREFQDNQTAQFYSSAFRSCSEIPKPAKLPGTNSKPP
jgi:hypothetical protein